METSTLHIEALTAKVDHMEKLAAEADSSKEVVENLNENVKALATKLSRTEKRTEEAITNILEVEKYYHQLSELIERMGKLLPQLELEEFKSPTFPEFQTHDLTDFDKGYESTCTNHSKRSLHVTMVSSVMRIIGGV